VPLFLLALADSVITFRAQRESGSIGAVQAFPVSLRIENAFVSYSEYLQKLLWPSKLAIFYPYPHSHPPAWQIGLAALILFGVTLAVISVARRFKYSCTGWLWYLGTLIPVIGLVQVGGQSIADRYAYIPMLGILVLVGWGLGDLAQNRPRARKVIIASVLCLILVFAVVARTQVSLWADSESVFFHAQSVTQSNYVAYNNLGEALAIRGRTDDAALWFARAVQANPDYAPAQQNLGMALIQQGSLDDGIDHARKATELDPRSFDALNKLGAALAKKGELDEAVASLNRALEISPSFAPALANLASVLEQQGKFEEAAICFEKAAQNAGSPEMAAQFQYRLGNLLSRKGDTAQAAEHYRAALRLKPDLSPAIEALRRIPSQSR
jgi:Flp pilus assembly protein TadD